MKQIPGTVVVMFKDGVGDSIISNYLAKEGVDGVRVSAFSPRYAVDVPPGREEEFFQKFSTSPLVKYANKNYLHGVRASKPRKEKEKEE